MVVVIICLMQRWSLLNIVCWSVTSGFNFKNFDSKIFMVRVDQEIGAKNCYTKFQNFSYGLEIVIPLVQKLKNGRSIKF